MRTRPHEFTPQQSWDLVFELIERYPDNPEVQWRAARAAGDLSELASTPVSTKKELLAKGLAWVTSAKAKLRDNGVVYRWSGILLAAQKPYVSTGEYIKNAFVVRDEFLQAAAIDPYDPIALHLLGRWHTDVASTSWIARQAASAFFAEPPSATVEEALAYYERAERVSPGFLKANQWMLAESCAALGRKEEAIAWAKAVLSTPNGTQDDRNAYAKCSALLARLDRAAAAALTRAEAAAAAGSAGRA